MKTNYFENFAATASGRRAVTLLTDHKVKPRQIFDTVLTEVTHAMPHLVDDGRYTAEMLCSPAIWRKWFKAERCVAGMVVAFMVKKPMVGLFRHITPSGKGKAKYRTTPPPVPLCRPIKFVRRLRTGSGRNIQQGA